MATAFSMGIAAPAFAQASEPQADAAAASDSGSQAANDIVVTATRRSESVRDVPFNIQAITSDTMAKTGATDILDLARTIPGLSFNDYGPGTGAKLVLRGLRTGGEAGLEPTTTVYVDEVPMDLPFRGTPLDLKLVDIERLEVLRGPQGTLFGGGAIGGTLRYISKKPDTRRFEGRVGAELSSTRHGGLNYELTGMINVPVADWIAVRANVGHFDNDGFIDNVTLGTDNVNDDRTTSSRIAVLIKPIDDLQIDLTYYRQAARYGEDWSLRESHPYLTTDVVHPGSSTFKAQLFNATLTYDFGWARLTSSSSYVDERLDLVGDGTFSIRDAIFGSFLPADMIPEFTVKATRKARSHSFTQEVRLVSDSDGPFNWILGGYYYNMRVREDYHELVPIPFPGQAEFEQNVIGAPLNDENEYTYNFNDHFRRYAVFGEVKYDITDAWQASVGGRYFDMRGTGYFYNIDQFFGVDARDANGLARTVPLPHEISTGSYREKGTVWRFNTSYDLGRAGLVYLTIAQGFRPGGFNRLTPNTGIPPEGRQFHADDLVSYELGGKFSLLRNRVYLSSALYYIDWSDIQTTVRTPLGFSFLGNAGKAVSKGVEIELNADNVVLPGLSFTLGYAFTDAKLKETIERVGFDGEHMPLVPRHTFSLMTDYSTDIGHGLELGFNWLATYTGSSNADFGPFKPVLDPVSGELVPSAQPNDQFLHLGSYWLNNMSLRLEGESWTARLFVDNLFDVRYKSGRSFVLANSNFATSDILFTPNRPRTIGIGFNKRF